MRVVIDRPLRWAYLGVLAILVAGPIAASRAHAQGPVIPPGREDVVVRLVGDALEGAGFQRRVPIRIERECIHAEVAELSPSDEGAPELVVCAPGESLPASVTPIDDAVGLECEGACSAAQVARARPVAQGLVRGRRDVERDLWIGSQSAPIVRDDGTPTTGHGEWSDDGGGWRRWGWDVTFGDLRNLRFETLELAADPYVHWIVLLIFLIGATATVGGVLRLEPSRHLWALAIVVVVGATLRAVVAHPQLMGVLSHQREVQWLWRLKAHGVPVLALLPDGLNRFEQAGMANFLVSVLLVPVIYAHARVLFGRSRPALLAAVLFAVLPMTIAFAKSEILLLSNAFFASVALTAVQRFATATRRLPLMLYAATAWIAHWCALESRPESIVLAVVCVPALLVYGGSRPWRARNLGLLGALGLLSANAVAQVSIYGRVTYAWGVGGGIPSGEELRHLLSMLDIIALRDNNYFLPDLLPIWLTASAALGLLLLLRRGDRGRFAYLLMWFLLIFGVHCLVGSYTRVIAARYGLHSLVPVLLAAAWGLDRVHERVGRWRPRQRWLRPAVVAAAAACVAFTSVPTLWILGPRHDDINAENRFLDDLWRRGIPGQGSLVVESYDDGEPARYMHVGIRVLGAWEAPVVRSANELRHNDGATYLYLGLPCVWRRRDDGAPSPACQASLATGRWERVASRRITEPLHDPSSGRRPADGGEVVLYRLLPDNAAP